MSDVSWLFRHDDTIVRKTLRSTVILLDLTLDADNAVLPASGTDQLIRGGLDHEHPLAQLLTRSRTWDE